MNNSRTIRPFGVAAFLDFAAFVKTEERIQAAD
jgi:hypothetical protein